METWFMFFIWTMEIGGGMRHYNFRFARVGGGSGIENVDSIKR